MCSVDCLRDTRGFLDEFTALGCEMEPIRYGVEKSAGFALNDSGVAQSGDDTSASATRAGTELANRMATQLDGVQRMIDALMPSVDSAVDELACTRNEAGHFCLLFTDALNEMMAAEQTQQQQAAQAAKAAGGRNANTENADTLAAEQAKRRCAFYEEMGCCAPMVVGVGYRAATAVEDVMGVKLSSQAAALTTADIIRQIQAECANITGGVVASEPCGASDAHMIAGDPKASYSAEDVDTFRKDMTNVVGGGGGSESATAVSASSGGDSGDGGGGGDGRAQLSGGAIAAIVVMALAAVALMVGTAFVIGGNKAKRAAKTIQLREIGGMQPADAANVATRSSSGI